MHRKLARGRRNNLHKLPQIDSVILCKLAKNKGRLEREYFFHHIRKVICGKNLKGIGRPRPVAPARFSLIMTLEYEQSAAVPVTVNVMFIEED